MGCVELLSAIYFSYPTILMRKLKYFSFQNWFDVAVGLMRG